MKHDRGHKGQKPKGTNGKGKAGKKGGGGNEAPPSTPTTLFSFVMNGDPMPRMLRQEKSVLERHIPKGISMQGWGGGAVLVLDATGHNANIIDFNPDIMSGESRGVPGCLVVAMRRPGAQAKIAIDGQPFTFQFKGGLRSEIAVAAG